MEVGREFEIFVKDIAVCESKPITLCEVSAKSNANKNLLWNNILASVRVRPG